MLKVWTKVSFISKPQLPSLQQTVANAILISNSNNLNKFWVGIFTRQGRINQVYSMLRSLWVSESMSDKHSQWLDSGPIKTGRRNNFQVSTNSTTHDKEERTSAAFLVAMISKKGREKHWSSLGTTLLTEATTLVGSTPVWTTPLGTIHVWTISDWTTRIFGLSPFGLPMTFGPK